MELYNQKRFRHSLEIQNSLDIQTDVYIILINKVVTEWGQWMLGDNYKV